MLDVAIQNRDAATKARDVAAGALRALATRRDLLKADAEREATALEKAESNAIAERAEQIAARVEGKAPKSVSDPGAALVGMRENLKLTREAIAQVERQLGDAQKAVEAADHRVNEEQHKMERLQLSVFFVELAPVVAGILRQISTPNHQRSAGGLGRIFSGLGQAISKADSPEASQQALLRFALENALGWRSRGFETATIDALAASIQTGGTVPVYGAPSDDALSSFETTLEQIAAAEAAAEQKAETTVTPMPTRSNASFGSVARQA